MFTAECIVDEDCHILRMVAERGKWDVILLVEDKLFYETMLNSLKNGKRYGGSEGNDSSTSVSTNGDELIFKSYTVVCGRDMDASFILNRDEGIRVLELAISHINNHIEKTD